MSKEYELYYRDSKAGRVSLCKCGMFYQLTCRFQTQEKGVFRLYADNGKEIIDLGQCVFYGQALGVERYMPVKSIGDGDLRFYVMEAGKTGTFVPIANDQPFYRFDELLNARFAIQFGRKGVLLDRNESDHSTAM